MIHQRIVIHDLCVDMEEVYGVTGPFLIEVSTYLERAGIRALD